MAKKLLQRTLMYPTSFLRKVYTVSVALLILLLPPLANAQKSLTDSNSITKKLQKLDEVEIVEAAKCRQIIGYYPSWQMYKRGGLMTPDNLDYSRYTILNYAFFAPDSLGYIAGTDAWADSILLRGQFDYGAVIQPAYIPNTSIIDYAHAWGVRVMISIGGWTLSEYFPRIAADPIRRKRFASECVRILRMYNFDGIDIDWEYPGYTEHKGTPADKRNFTLLMQEIRDSIDTYGKKIKYDFYLTAALGANDINIVNIEWDKIQNILDMMNLMTYDFNGVWSEDANHNSPLYSPAKGSVGSSDYAFKMLTQKYGVNPEKLNMGVPFYGRSLFGKDGEKVTLHTTNHSGKADTLTFIPDDGGVEYFNILNFIKEFDYHWDDVAKVPYLTGKKKNVFVSYDDEKAIRMKAEYAKKNGCAGVIIWDCTSDYIEVKPGTGTIKGTPLSNELVSVLKPCVYKPIRKKTHLSY